MKHLKKVRIILLCVIFMSLLVVGTSAAFYDQDMIENETAVNMCVSLNIIRGRDDGKFDPQSTATRAEMAKMICIILSRGNEPIWGTKPVPSYRDTKGHWAEAYIEYCTDLGIVAGMGDGTFNPNGKVTGTQAAKMLLVALGYDAVYEGFNGANWSFKINMAASQKGLYDDLEIDPNDPVSRDNAAQMIWNALNASMVRYTYALTSVNGVLQTIKIAGEYSDNRSLLKVMYNSAEYIGQLSKFSYHPAKEEWTYEIVNPGASPAAMTFTSKLNYTGLYGQNVHAVYQLGGGEKMYGMFAEDSTVLFSGVMNDLTIKTDGIIFSGTTYALDNGTSAATKAHAFLYDTAFQGDRGTALNALYEAQKTYSFTAIDSDNDGKVDFLMTYPYTVSKVSYVGPKSITAGSSYLKEDCEIYDGIVKDDYTKITAAANTDKGKTRLDAVDKMVSGTVTKVRGSDYYIDGIGYALTSGISMTVGDTVKNAVVVNHFIFDAKVSNLAIEDYALVMDAVESSANGLFGHQAKLLLSDGTKRIVSTTRAYLDLKGQMVTYEENRDDAYELKRVDYETTNGTYFDKAISSGAGKITSASGSNKVLYIDHCNIADDAVIFVREGDGSPENPFAFQVITGAALLNINKFGLSLVGAFAEQSSSGFDTVKLAYISTTEKLVSADTQYGYAVLDYAQVKNRYNETVYEYTIWNGREQVTVLAKYGLRTDLHKGDVIAYTLNADGFVDQMSVYATKGANPAAEVAAITAYDGTYLRINGADADYKIEEETKVIYVDNEEVRGVDSGTISLANQESNGTYRPNALVLTEGNVINLIIVDVNNEMVR